MNAVAGSPNVVYIHGAGNKPPADDLKGSWDHDLFGRDMGQRTRIAYYADLLHEHPGAVGPDACSDAEALADIVEKATEPRAESDAGSPNLFNDLKRFAPSSDMITAHHRLRPLCRKNE